MRKCPKCDSELDELREYYICNKCGFIIPKECI